MPITNSWCLPDIHLVKREQIQGEKKKPQQNLYNKCWGETGNHKCSHLYKLQFNRKQRPKPEQLTCLTHNALSPDF